MKKLVFQYDPSPLQQNPALRAWLKVAGSDALPLTIDRFIGQHDRSLLYRFHGAGDQGQTVIAKSAEPKSLEKEYNVYVQVLPHIPLPRLKCYGIGQDEEGRTWLFLEEARGMSYRDNDPQHVEHASNWLGTFHAATTGRFREWGFPEIGFDHYAPTLEEAISRISYFRKEAERVKELGQLMGNLESYLFRIQSEWEGLKQKLTLLPSCIAHLDFVKKNIRLDFTGSEPVVQVMDWGSSRYGLPVRDMAGLNRQVYHAAGRQVGMKLTLEEVKLGEQVGQLLKTVLYLYEEMSNPELLNRAKSIDNLKAYEHTFSSFWSAEDYQ